MAAAELVERLRNFPRLANLPQEQLIWLATRGRLTRFEQGEILSSTGQMVAGAFVVLSGHLVLYVRRGEHQRKVAEWRTGEIAGLLPYSRMKASPGETVAVEACEFLTIASELFPEMIRDCHELTAVMVHTMIDRARLFNATDLRDEKMISLGKLAAGLAHELNNPASAIVRSASGLAERQREAERSARELGRAGVDDERIALLETARDDCLRTQPTGIPSPLEQADREDGIADWLEDRGVDASLAEPLAETSISLEALERLAQAFGGEMLGLALRWLAGSCAAGGLALEIGEAATRIHALVGAVKGFTHLDQARDRQPVDIGRGLSDTLAMLEGVARERRIGVRLVLAPELPPVAGFGSELNQVWMNLIDNALDAAPPGGSVEVTASLEGGRVVVRVIDDGAGIAADALPHIFDPFFTTKGVGEGTGLGLDIARRLIWSHDGEIEIESRPGRTEFRVDLPAGEPSGRSPSRS